MPDEQGPVHAPEFPPGVTRLQGGRRTTNADGVSLCAFTFVSCLVPEG